MKLLVFLETFTSEGMFELDDPDDYFNDFMKSLPEKDP